jgi:hypothetical protein
MPIEIKFVGAGLGVEFIAKDLVTGAEIIEANKRVYRHKTLSKLRYQLIDRTNCTEYQVSNEEIEKIAAQDTEAAMNNPDIIEAFVATTDLQYGITRMYQALVGEHGFQTGLYRDRASAQKWLEDQLAQSDADHKPDR